jgi:hypothetical protein
MTAHQRRLGVYGGSESLRYERIDTSGSRQQTLSEVGAEARQASLRDW